MLVETARKAEAEVKRRLEELRYFLFFFHSIPFTTRGGPESNAKLELGNTHLISSDLRWPGEKALIGCWRELSTSTGHRDFIDP